MATPEHHTPTPAAESETREIPEYSLEKGLNRIQELVEERLRHVDRPLVVAIGDGVSSALRSAEIARLATQTAWERTFHHLHALRAPAVNRAGAGNSLEFP